MTNIYVLQRELNGVTSYFRTSNDFTVPTTRDINGARIIQEEDVEDALQFCRTKDKRVWTVIQVNIIRRTA